MRWDLEVLRLGSLFILRRPYDDILLVSVNPDVRKLGFEHPCENRGTQTRLDCEWLRQGTLKDEGFLYLECKVDLFLSSLSSVGGVGRLK